MKDSTFATMTMPIDGYVLSLSKSPDEEVAQGLLGRGILINPTGNTIYAPCDGEVVLVYPSKHAIIIKSVEGLAVLIHVGLNMDLLEGKPFNVLVKDGDIVKRNDILMEFDREMMIQLGYSLMIPFVFPNLNNQDFMSILQMGKVEAKKQVVKIKKK